MPAQDALRFALTDHVAGRPVGVSRIPLALLGQFRGDIETFLKGSNRDIDPNEVFVSIEDGSFAIMVNGLLPATSLWADIERLQGASDLSRLDPKRAAVVESWQKAAQKHPQRRYAVSNTNASLLVRVDASTTFHRPADNIWIPVEKYIEGTVVEFGGATNANIHLRLPTGKLLIIESNPKELSGLDHNPAYKTALLHVLAEENLATNELRNFKLVSFEKRRFAWDQEAFDALTEKGTQAWADVPDNWLETLRSH